MDISRLKEALADQLTSIFALDPTEIEREISFKSHLAAEEVTVITGVRRSGKSMLLRQIAKTVKEKSNIHYINFEDFRLRDFTVEDFPKAYQIFQDLIFSSTKKQTIVMYDEIQEVAGWEKWVSSLVSKRETKIFITGSNSTLLSTDLATYLTGRHKQIYVAPFSFKEIVKADQNINLTDSLLTTSIKNALRKTYFEYSRKGGFPRVFLSGDAELLKQYYEDIILKDIVRRNKIRRVPELLASQNTRQFNRSRAAKSIEIADQTTITKFCRYFTNSYLYHEIKQFSRSRRSQVRSLSKFYAIDTQLAMMNGYHHSTGNTWILENQVFLNLKLKFSEIFYWKSKEGYEVDFIIRTPDGNLHGVQASTSLEDEKTKEREVRGLQAAKRELGTKSSLIVTELDSGDVEAIPVVPFYEWALN